MNCGFAIRHQLEANRCGSVRHAREPRSYPSHSRTPSTLGWPRRSRLIRDWAVGNAQGLHHPAIACPAATERVGSCGSRPAQLVDLVGNVEGVTAKGRPATGCAPLAQFLVAWYLNLDRSPNEKR